MAPIRQLVPRASLALHSKQLQHRLLAPRLRNASSTPPPKPRVLEKPERFNPPSHPSRRARPRQYPGPPLSEHERQAQITRQYPHMMPPEGTFMRWFLTSRVVHTVITLTVLVSLMLAIWFSDFYYKTPYQDLLPPNSLFYSHPFTFIARYWEVYRMNVEYISQETAERRRRKVEDVKKRSEYRQAHGLDQEGIFGGWTAKTDAQAMGPALREGGDDADIAAPGPRSTKELAVATANNIEGKGEEDVYVDFEGKSQPVKKKWFGIW